VSAAPGVDAERRTPHVRLRPILITLGVVVLVMVSLRFVAEPMRVSSDSMSPTFSTGDEVLVQKLGAHAREPGLGDIVVVRSPASGEMVIKRVAAVGGQTVGIADGVLKVDGAAVPEPYVDRAEVDGTYFGPVRVPPGTVFVLGDQRLGSVDSRSFGPVPVGSIVGRVMVRVWPP
jgi:signal peptidase I